MLVAQRKVNKYKKLIAGQSGKVHPPNLSVDRHEQGNVHGRISPRVIVLHSTESHDRPGTNDITAVLRYLENHPQALGIHYVIDKEAHVGRGALHHQMVYHAKGANSISIGIEQIGFAHSTEWKSKDRIKQLDGVAKLLAYISKVEGIPLTRSTTHGVAAHRDFPQGGHTDPGSESEYPMGYVIRLARQYRKEGW